MLRNTLPNAVFWLRSSFAASTGRFFSNQPSFNSYFRWTAQVLAAANPEHRLLAYQSDIAGSLVDPYCTLPLNILAELFRDKFHCELTLEQIVGPMGLKKQEHIRLLLAAQNISDDHLSAQLTTEFYTRLSQKIADPEYTQLIPHMEKFVRFLKQQNLKFATSSGYDRDAADLALQQFFTRLGKEVVDASSTPSEVANGERSEMIYRNLDHLKIYREHAHRTIFASDAPADFKSLHKAAQKTPGHTPWLIGLPSYSTLLRFRNRHEAAALSPSDLQHRRLDADTTLAPYTNVNCFNVVDLLKAIVACQRAIALDLKPLQSDGTRLQLNRLILPPLDTTLNQTLNHSSQLQR